MPLPALEPGQLAGHLARPLGRLQLAQGPRLPAEQGEDRADQDDQRQQQRQVDDAALPEGVARKADGRIADDQEQDHRRCAQGEPRREARALLAFEELPSLASPLADVEPSRRLGGRQFARPEFHIDKSPRLIGR